MIKLITFDISDVLCANISFTDALVLAISKHKAISRSDIISILQVSHKLSSEDEFDYLANNIDIGLDKKAFLREIYNQLAVKEELVNLIKELREKGYKTAYFSNRKKVTIDLIELVSEIKLFDFGSSREVNNFLKPDKNAYLFFLELAEINGIKPEEIIYIDDKEENIIPAKELGMSGIMFTGVEDLKKKFSRFLL